MAHARMSGIFRVGEIDPTTVMSRNADLSLLREDAERELIKALLDFPRVVAGAAQSLEPNRIAAYLLETARLTHHWYHKHHVLGADDVRDARLVLAAAARVVLRNGLTILGITAPERM
jgi:arginyl-tRNA synthetase